MILCLKLFVIAKPDVEFTSKGNRYHGDCSVVLSAMWT